MRALRREDIGAKNDELAANRANARAAGEKLRLFGKAQRNGTGSGAAGSSGARSEFCDVSRENHHFPAIFASERERARDSELRHFLAFCGLTAEELR